MKKALIAPLIAIAGSLSLEIAGGAEAQVDPARIGDYGFSMGGKPFKPRIYYLAGEPGKPAPGDIIRIDPLYVLLGEEKDWRIERAEKEPPGLRWIQDGKPRWLAASTGWTYGERSKTVLDGLAALSPEDLKGLRAVSLESWDDQVARNVALLDPARASIRITEDALQGRKRTLPPLPAGLRFLSIDASARTGNWNEPLAKLSRLELLDVDGGTLDVRVLERLSSLRFLRIGPKTTVQHLGSLGKLKALRHLDLESRSELVSLDPILPCTELRELLIGRTGIRDLSLLVRFPHLREVAATEAPIATLPAQRVPALREVGLVKTMLSDSELAAFRHANPACTVYPQTTQAFRTALQGVDLIRLRTRSWTDATVRDAVADVGDRSSIDAFISMIAVDAVRPHECSCFPDTFIEFFKGAKLVEFVTVHHGIALISEFLGGDGILEKESAEKVVRWLFDHGAKNPLNEIERSRSLEQTEERKTARCMQGVRESVRKAFTQTGERFGQALREAYPREEERITVLLRILGADNEPGTLMWQEQLADTHLRKLPATKLGPVCEKVLLGRDRQARRGAAWFFEAQDSPLADWALEDPVKVHRAIIEIEVEARSTSVRQRALKNLHAWAHELEPSEVDRRLEAALRDPDEQVRRAAVLIAGEMVHGPSERLLLDVFQGRPVNAIPLPEVPADEKEDLENNADEVGGKAEAKDLAALALGYLESAAARPLIESKAKESDFCRVALALYGKPEVLRAEDFRRRDRNQAIQLAAVQAVVRAKGRSALQLALGYEQATHWWEEDLVTRKVRDMLLRNAAPGEDDLRNASTLKHLRAWFDAHGAAYVGRVKK